MDSRSRVVLVVLLFFGIGLTPMGALAQEDDISVTVPDEQVEPGETVTLSIQADLGSNEVTSYTNMTFTYDETVLEVVDVRDGDGLSFGPDNFEPSIDNDNGEVRATNVADNPPVTGSGEFLEIEVQLIQDGTTPFELAPSDTEGSRPTSIFQDEDIVLEITQTQITQGSVMAPETNDPPEATDDSYSTPEDQTLTIAAPGVLENDSDPNGDELTPSVVSGVSNGSLTLNDDGSFEYVPDADFNGSDSFTYEVVDDSNATDQATATITVDPRNDAPTAEDDSYETPVDQTLTVDAPGVLENDSDPDGDVLTPSVVEDVSNGSLALNDDGSFEYTPSGGFSGPDSFTYEVADDSSATDEATASIEVVANQAPTAEDDSYTTPEDQTLTVDAPGVLENDSDPEGDALTASVASTVSNGSLTLNDDGSFEYAPDEDFNGTDSFTYAAADGNGGSSEATATITVAPRNDVPVAGDDSYTTPEDQTLTVDAPGVLENDSDPEGDALTASVVSTVSNGSLTLNDDGSFEYAPDADFNGTDGFTYAAADGNGGSNEATVTITVAPRNDAPVAEDDGYETPVDQTLTVDAPGVLGNDSDPDGDVLTPSVVSDVSNGSLTLTNNGSFEYTPSGGFSGTDSFTYDVADDSGGTAQATASIEVEANQAPTAEDDSYETPEDQTLTVDAPGVLENDSDPEGDALTASVVEDVSNGSLTVNSDGSFEYQPNADFNGSDTFRYEGADPEGLSDEATVTISITPVNDPPTVVASLPDHTLEVPGPPLQLTGLGSVIFTDPDGDALTFSASSSNSAVVEVLSGGGQGVTLQPEGTGTAEVTATASDGEASVSADLFTVVVEERPTGEEVPSDQAVAMVDTSGNSSGVDFANTGVAATFQNVQTGGIVEVSFFSGDSGPSGAAASFPSDETFENVSPYQWTVSTPGVEFGSVDLSFALDHPGVGGIGAPADVTILRDAEGDGSFEAVTTVFDDGGTPSDSTDDVLVAQDLTSVSTFKFASDSTDNPLPVELTEFSARLDGETAQLQWRTASETNNAGFEVQHKSSQATSYDEAAFVESKVEGGSTSEPQVYRYLVEDLSPGTHWFRLRQVNTDGTSRLSKTVSVTVQMEEALQLRAPTPNPVRSEARLRFGVQKAGEATLTLYNVLGQRVATLYDGVPTPGKMQSVQLDAGRLSELPSGTYFVRLEAHGMAKTQRLVLVR